MDGLVERGKDVSFETIGHVRDWSKMYSASRKNSPPPQKKRTFCDIFTCGEPV